MAFAQPRSVMRLLTAFAVLILALPARAQFPLPVVGPDGTDWEVTEIQAALDGAVYVMGSFENELTLGGSSTPTLVWNAPNPTGWIARFGADGALEWAHALEARRQNFNDESNAYAKRITALPDGSVVLLGTLTAGIYIDVDPGPGEVRIGPPGIDPFAFLVRYNADGSYGWSGSVVMTGSASLTGRLGLGQSEGRVFALVAPGPDSDPGPATVATTAHTLIAMDAATGATAYVQPTSLPVTVGFTSGVPQGLAASGGSVYVLGHTLPLSGQNRFTLARHDAATGTETWTFTPTDGRDLLTEMEPGASGSLIAAAALSSSATGIALDPVTPGTLTLSRNGDARTALARYTPAGALDWAEAVEVNIGAWGGGIAVEGGEIFASGFGHLRAYAEADGALLRSLPATYGTPNLRDLAAGPGRITSYVNPAGNASFEIQGVPPDLPPTLLVQFEQSDLSLVISPPVVTEPGTNASALSIHRVVPHPVRQQGEVVVSLPEADHARLVVVDAMGREVAVLVDGPLTPGEHVIPLERRALAPGQYLLVFQAGGQRAARSLVVVR